MKIIRTTQTKKVVNSRYCTAIEYPLNDKDINGAKIILKGRFPDTGWTVNLICKEIAYILKGSGKLVVEGKEYSVSRGDLAFIEPKEKFYWEGNMEIFMPCAPAWYPEQHKVIE